MEKGKKPRLREEQERMKIKGEINERIKEQICEKLPQGEKFNHKRKER
jgi:hypothetical protein